MFLDPEKPIDKHRLNLPHWQQGEAWVFVTWRLADSLPEAVVRKLVLDRKLWLEKYPKPWDEETQKEYGRLFTMRFEALLDDAHGSCVLKYPEFRAQVTGALHHFNGGRYDLDCYVVMPNHVHVLFRPLGEHKLEAILQSWKRHSARQINKVRGEAGSLWQREYWDRLVRSQKHFEWTRDYTVRNPTKLSPGTFSLWQWGEGI
jgi:type I restriction enzyme R subunit